jgi:hypothetical protein
LTDDLKYVMVNLLNASLEAMSVEDIDKEIAALKG